MADEGVRLCDSRSYGLLRWPARFQQALLAAARGDSATARAITDEMIGWAAPRRAGAVRAYAWHARALDAIGRADFESAYRDACAVNPAGTIASHVPHAMWMVLDLVEAAALPAAQTRPPPMSRLRRKPVFPRSRHGWP